jgi:HpcH/HpaI aldolase/citrate lyase family
MPTHCRRHLRFARRSTFLFLTAMTVLVSTATAQKEESWKEKVPPSDVSGKAGPGKKEFARRTRPRTKGISEGPESRPNRGADALILDLEDSVPPNLKNEARSIVRSKLGWLAERQQRIFVRINRSPHLYDFDDIVAVVGPHVEGIMISKPVQREAVRPPRLVVRAHHSR